MYIKTLAQNERENRASERIKRERESREGENQDISRRLKPLLI